MCGSLDLLTPSWVEEPLLRGGGYGAARITIKKLCVPCGWETTAEVSEVRPSRRVKVSR